MTKFFLTTGIIFLMALFACKKETNSPLGSAGDNPKDNLPQYLLKEISWDNGMKALSHYNSDSTVSKITFGLGSSSGQTVYAWDGRKLLEMYDTRSEYTNKFLYDDKGRLAAIHHTKKNGQPTVSYSLEYTYNDNQRLQQLRYYDVNEAGKQLKETTNYHYGTNGDLVKMVTQSGGNLITRTIDAYSDTLSFDYTHYLSTSLNENYSFYNYPVLSKLVRLPARVTKRVKIGASTETVDKIEEMTYTLHQYRIDKVVTKLSFPEHPAYNQTQEAVYSYY